MFLSQDFQAGAHEEAGVADFKELLEDLLALTPREREGEERAPEQDDHFSDVLKHGSIFGVRLF